MRKHLVRRIEKLEARPEPFEWWSGCRQANALALTKLSPSDQELVTEALQRRANYEALDERLEEVWKRWRVAVDEANCELKPPLPMGADDWYL